MAHELQLQLTSSGPPAANPPSHTQYPISSYPLDKYSFSVTHATETSFSTSQMQWTHYAHRDNLFLVVDTSLVSGPVRSTFLKVIWGTQVLVCSQLKSFCVQVFCIYLGSRNILTSLPCPIRLFQPQIPTIPHSLLCSR